MSNLNNQLFIGDNLVYLKELTANSVDLCYIDPPFYTNKNWEDFDDRFDSMEAYLEFMRPRIQEIHRVLKTTGSFYLHCDKHAVHYLKVLCDEIFGCDKFRSEIIWKRTDRIKGTANNFGTQTDTILYYSKTKRFTFNLISIPLSDDQIAKYYSKLEPDTLRQFNTAGMFLPGASPKSLIFVDR